MTLTTFASSLAGVSLKMSICFLSPSCWSCRAAYLMNIMYLDSTNASINSCLKQANLCLWTIGKPETKKQNKIVRIQIRKTRNLETFENSSLHWLYLLSKSSFLYNGVYWVYLMLSICDVIVSQKRYNGEWKKHFFGRGKNFIRSLCTKNIFGQMPFESILSQSQSHQKSF